MSSAVAVRSERDTRILLFGAVTMAVLSGLTELLRPLVKLLFTYIYYGNLNGIIFGLSAGVVLFTMTLCVHGYVSRHTGVTPFQKHSPLPYSRRAVLYVMTVLPIILVSALLGFKFKLVWELGHQVSKMSMWGNAAGYFHAAARLFAAVYTVHLTEQAFSAEKVVFPVGGAAAAVLYGIPTWLADPSILSPVYFALFFYVGVLWRMSKKRFFVTYALALVLYIL